MSFMSFIQGETVYGLESSAPCMQQSTLAEGFWARAEFIDCQKRQHRNRVRGGEFLYKASRAHFVR